jgi:esterase FrsA
VKNRCSALQAAPGVTLYHTGPALDHGPLPSLFYFSLSGSDSLCLDPYNQPIQFLQGKMIRIFSLTLPGHESGLLAKDAMNVWADDIQKGKNIFNEFLDQSQIALDFAIREKFIDPAHLSIAGLSRGAFAAAHLAARDERFLHLVCFAPLTCLHTIKEFKHLQENPIVKSLDLIYLSKHLKDRHIALFIGNDDTRVGTRKCFEWMESLVKEKQKRISHVELKIYPSVGNMGHGTPPEIFCQGANWIASHFGI